MQRKSFATMECPIARSLEETGDGWTLLILRNALLGARRFQDFQARLGIAPNTLTRRLERLVELGFFTRQRYAARPPREEYELTAKGLDFVPVLLALAAWGNRWVMREAVAIECMDPRSGHKVEPVLVDRRTRRELVAGAVGLRAGPRASRQLRQALKRGVVLGAKRQPEVAR
jgi:DNA-binding HxlR family transcriptional regulator